VKSSLEIVEPAGRRQKTEFCVAAEIFGASCVYLFICLFMWVLIEFHVEVYLRKLELLPVSGKYIFVNEPR
jgi:hypothetical protein